LHRVGGSVKGGEELALHEGIAEFRMANGVFLGIEGPASLLLVSPSTVVLQYGKLTANVPWGSEAFKVVTAGGRVTAGDGEFGLWRTGNKLEVHVFSGEATATNSIVATETGGDTADGDFSAADGKGYFRDAVIAAGRSLRLTTNGELLTVAGWGKARSGLFVSKLSMSGPLPVTTA
jgi:hypothetical protein